MFNNFIKCETNYIEVYIIVCKLYNEMYIYSIVVFYGIVCYYLSHDYIFLGCRVLSVDIFMTIKYYI